jgi:hypothetical protein
MTTGATFTLPQIPWSPYRERPNLPLRTTSPTDRGPTAPPDPAVALHRPVDLVAVQVHVGVHACPTDDDGIELLVHAIQAP